MISTAWGFMLVIRSNARDSPKQCTCKLGQTRKAQVWRWRQGWIYKINIPTSSASVSTNEVLVFKLTIKDCSEGYQEQIRSKFLPLALIKSIAFFSGTTGILKERPAKFDNLLRLARTAQCQNQGDKSNLHHWYRKQVSWSKDYLLKMFLDNFSPETPSSLKTKISWAERAEIAHARTKTRSFKPF